MIRIISSESWNGNWRRVRFFERSRRDRVWIRSSRQRLESLLASPEEWPLSKHPRSPKGLAFQQSQRRPTPSGAIATTWPCAETRYWRSIQPREWSQDRRATTLRKVGEASVSKILFLCCSQHCFLCDLPLVSNSGNYPWKLVHHNVRSNSFSDILVWGVSHMVFATVLTSGTEVF